MNPPLPEKCCKKCGCDGLKCAERDDWEARFPICRDLKFCHDKNCPCHQPPVASGEAFKPIENCPWCLKPYHGDTCGNPRAPKEPQKEPSPEPTTEWEENLKDELEEQLHEMLRLTALMQPKSDAEFIAVALPNLHIKMHEIIRETLLSQHTQIREEVIRAVKVLLNQHTGKHHDRTIRCLLGDIEDGKLNEALTTLDL